jgi:toxin ParE1/3/4
MKDSPRAAERLVKEVRTRVEALSTSPFIGRIVPEQKRSVDKDLREILLGNYRIVYHVGVDVVNILNVFHAKRNFNVEKDIDPER